MWIKTTPPPLRFHPRMTKHASPLFAIALPASALGQTPAPTAATVLSTLRKEHPRLLATGDDFRALRERIAKHPKAAEWAAVIRKEGDEVLGAAPSEYVIPDGKR